MAPFAGATRNLCDRKEVTLDDQTSALAKFYIFTSTHAAAHFTGVITDDFTSEFDPFSPQFGEKFAPPNLPISIKDWTGNEISRVYSDQWGAYNGLTYSTWEVNPPNPTGYAPTMMVTCMNDPGTGRDSGSAVQPGTTASSATRFRSCRADPVHGYAGRAHVRLRRRRLQQSRLHLPGCHAGHQRSGWRRSRTVGERGTGHTLTITALGDQTGAQQCVLRTLGHNGSIQPEDRHPPLRLRRYAREPWPWSAAMASPSADRCTAGATRQITGHRARHAGVARPAPSSSRRNTAATVNRAQCGELVITAANGKQSIDTVTVTIGGKAPTHVAASIRRIDASRAAI